MKLQLGCYLGQHNVKQRGRGVIVMCKAFNNNDYIGLGGHEKQHLLFSLVHLILCWEVERMNDQQRMKTK